MAYILVLIIYLITNSAMEWGWNMFNYTLWSMSAFLDVEFVPHHGVNLTSANKLSQFSSNSPHCNSQYNCPELQFQAGLDGVAVICS